MCLGRLVRASYCRPLNIKLICLGVPTEGWSLLKVKLRLALWHLDSQAHFPLTLPRVRDPSRPGQSPIPQCLDLVVRPRQQEC
ncbi:hypothetical protein SAMN04515618_11416 [Collimonas sp. OK307]|nr:hypothetical protein SAMN04515618_11416 [Collimonas sp. OK307]